MDRTVRLSVTQLRKPHCRCVLWDQDRHRQRGAVSSELFRHRRPLPSQTRRQETARAARPWGAPCGHSSAPTFQLGSRSAFSGGSTASRRTVAIRTDLRSRRADPRPRLRSTGAVTIVPSPRDKSSSVSSSMLLGHSFIKQGAPLPSRDRTLRLSTLPGAAWRGDRQARAGRLEGRAAARKGPFPALQGRADPREPVREKG